jgi:hypothetical protein
LALPEGFDDVSMALSNVRVVSSPRSGGSHGTQDVTALPGLVVTYAPDEHRYADTHERVTRRELARRVASLKGFGFADEYSSSVRRGGQLYFVPADTLTAERARELGIASEHDLFGGVATRAFIATKAITHPLVDADARAPVGWSADFAQRLHDAVLYGFSAFTLADARRAGRRVLERGPVRIKAVRETGGRGQVVASDDGKLRAALDAIDPEEVTDGGLVLEENLADVTTFSVGQVRVANLLATYHGTQRLTTSNSGATVYGGSDLTVVRGDFEALLRLDLSEDVRLAIAHGCAYDRAAMDCFPGLFASRRNYDVASGLDAAGRRRCGVLEQSWRMGGASGAEIAALEAFQADPALVSLRASTFEIYGSSEPPGADAIVYFRGIDERIGPLTKYALVRPP